MAYEVTSTLTPRDVGAILPALDLCRSCSSSLCRTTSPLLSSPERGTLTPTSFRLWEHRREFTHARELAHGHMDSDSLHAAAALVKKVVAKRPLIEACGGPPAGCDAAFAKAPISSAYCERASLPAKDPFKDALLKAWGEKIVGDIYSIRPCVPSSNNPRCSAILPGLYMGSVPLKKDQTNLNMKLIIRAAHLEKVDCRLGQPQPGVALIEIPQTSGGGFNNVMDCLSKQGMNLIGLFHTISQALLAREVVHIHCSNGEDRSAVITAAFVMWLMDMPPKDAMSYVQVCRPKAVDRTADLIQFQDWFIKQDARK